MCNGLRRELTIRFWELKGKVFFFCYLERVLIVELAEHSPIIIQNSSNPSSQSLYDCMTVQPYKVLLLTCVVNYTMGTPMPWLYPVVQWSVHWALSWTSRVLVLAGARLCALETSREKKKLQTPLVGLAKSIYYFDS